MKRYFKLIILISLALIMAISGYLGYNYLNMPRVMASQDIISISLGMNQPSYTLAPDIKVVFNPSGTHVKNGELKVRLDVYLGGSYECYDKYNVDVFDREPTEKELADPKLLALVPTHKELTPALCHFVTIKPDTTVAELDAIIKQVFGASTVSTIDNSLILDGSSHYLSPLMRDKTYFTAEKVVDRDADSTVSTVNERFKDLSFDSEGIKGNSGIETKPESIDVGPGATNRDSYLGGEKTSISAGNPANATGIIDTWELYAVYANLTSCEVATFFLVSDNNLTSRDYETIGTVTYGSKQTFSGLNTDIVTGDYAGLHYVTGYIRVGSGGAGIWIISADRIPSTNQTYSWSSGYDDSIYGTGTESSTISISNDPSTKAFGTIATSSTYYAKGSAPNNPVQDSDCTFTITNSGSQCDLDMNVSDATGGVGANIVSTSPGSNEIRMTSYYSGQNPASGLVLANTDQEFYDAFAVSATLLWDFKLELGTSTDGVAKSASITITARAET